MPRASPAGARGPEACSPPPRCVSVVSSWSCSFLVSVAQLFGVPLLHRLASSSRSLSASHAQFKRRQKGTTSPVRAMFGPQTKMARLGHTDQADGRSGPVAVAGRSTLPQRTAPSASSNQFLASFLPVAHGASCTRLERPATRGKEWGFSVWLPPGDAIRIEVETDEGGTTRYPPAGAPGAPGCLSPSLP